MSQYELCQFLKNRLNGIFPLCVQQLSIIIEPVCICRI